MAKLLTGTITFIDPEKSQRSFKVSARTEGRKEAARVLGLPGSSDEHLRSKDVLHVSVDGKKVYSSKEALRLERRVEIALENGEEPKRPTPLHCLVQRSKIRRLAERFGHRPIALVTLPEDMAVA